MRNFHVALMIGDEGVEDVQQLIEQPSLGRDSRKGVLDDDVHFFAKHEQEEILLGLRVIEQRTGPDVGLGCDLLRSGRVETFACKESSRGASYFRASLESLTLAPSAGHLD
jgi:hypothetical protein